MAGSQIYDFPVISFGSCLWNAVRPRAVTSPDNDVRWIDRLLSLHWFHCDIHLHARSPPNRDSDDGYGDRIGLGESGRGDNAAGLRALLCNHGEVTVFSSHRPGSHWRRNCGSLLRPINSGKAASRDIAQRGWRATEWMTGKPEFREQLSPTIAWRSQQNHLTNTKGALM